MKALFLTSNGTGLGHLSRSMAIARRLPGDSESRFFTLSQAAPVVAETGRHVDYFPSYRRPGSGSDWQWNLRLRYRLEQLFEEAAPDVAVFDGVHPYRALTHVLTAREVPAIWSRRPLWQAGSPAAALARTGAFDAVLEPGELAEAADRGATVGRRDEAVRVAPIVYLDRDELLDREAAAAALGLDPDRPTALVSLGQGSELDRAVASVLGRLGAEPSLQLVALQSSISGRLEVPEGTIALRGRFPISRYYRAFDFVVAAAGYNAFHELIHFGVPSLFVPMARQTDDQAARARWAEANGAGLAATGPLDPGLAEQAARLLDRALRERIAAAALRSAPANGAADAAGLVAAVAAGEDEAPAVRRRGRLHRWYRHSSHPVGPSLPLAAALTARDLARHPDRRPPLAVIEAIGLGEGAGERIAAELATLGVEPGRVLVVTDSWDLAALRRLGVGFEHVPSAAEAEALGADPAQLQRERIREIMRRRRPRISRSIGSGPVPFR